MRSFYAFLLLFISINATAQIVQTSIGAVGRSETFAELKYDPADGGTVHVGSMSDPTSGNGSDCFIVKFNSFHQIVWQKSIPNPGNDQFNQVIVAANGDFIVTGVYAQGGTFRGIVCRYNGVNGNLIWSSTSAGTASPNGDKYYDVYETSANNLVIAGVSNFGGGLTNAMVVLLNSSGNLLWSKVSNYGNSDEFYSVNQLPGGNLILGGFYSNGSFYTAVILELSEVNGNILSQMQYPVSVNVPTVGNGLNSTWLTKCLKRNNRIYFMGGLFQGFGFGSSAAQAIFLYDETTKNLSGNIYYHTGVGNATAYTFHPIADNDFIISQTFSTPSTAVYVSRITGGNIIYDRKVNGAVSLLGEMDLLNSEMTFTGSLPNGALQDAFNLSSPISFPVTSAPCNITNSNTLVLQALNLSASASNILVLNNNNPLATTSPGLTNAGYTLNNICGCENNASISVQPASSSVCENGSTTISVTATNALNYQWEVNTGSVWTAIVNNSIYSGANTNNLTLSGATLAMNGYQYRVNVLNSCYSLTSSAATLTVNPLVVPSISIQTSANPVCAGDNVIFTATVTNGGNSPQVQWQKNSINVGTNSLTYSDNGLNNGDVISASLVSNANCASPSTASSNNISITVNATVPNIRYTTIITSSGLSTQLQARMFSGATYIWMPPTGLNNPNIIDPVFNSNQSHEYLISISSAGNCEIVDTLLVTVEGAQQTTGIYVPQGFTPNGDGNNDRLFPFLVNIDQLRYFRVFNRWGNLLFETNSGNPSLGWDGKYKGKMQPVETYTWTAEGIDIYGKTIKKAGNTLLIN